MPCFTITVVYPPHKKDVVNRMNGTYFIKYVERYGGVCRISAIADHAVYDIILCDEDAAAFLRDLPEPFIVAYILYTSSGRLFYKHAKIQKRPIPPPHNDKVLMDVYWNASACERNFKPLVSVTASRFPYPA